jgi:hypothetical protein
MSQIDPEATLPGGGAGLVRRLRSEILLYPLYEKFTMNINIA